MQVHEELHLTHKVPQADNCDEDALNGIRLLVRSLSETEESLSEFEKCDCHVDCCSKIRTIMRTLKPYCDLLKEKR
jgi:hypothetical protein